MARPSIRSRWPGQGVDGERVLLELPGPVLPGEPGCGRHPPPDRRSRLPGDQRHLRSRDRHARRCSRRYADRFEADPARWKFLTGDFAVIKKLADESFLLPAEVGVHSERGVVFDRQGRLRGSYHLLQEDRVALLEKLVRDVLAEEPAADWPAAVPEAATP